MKKASSSSAKKPPGYIPETSTTIYDNIEEDIRALQLDSSVEESKEMVQNENGGKPDESSTVSDNIEGASDDRLVYGKEQVTSTAASASEHTEEVEESNKKRHLNVVFIGHVDAGKSTIGGQILYLGGQVDERTIQKYEKEAKDKSRESWYMAYIMDTNEEERLKGKTVEVGRAHFETETTRFTILDAPGHKSYVPNMISGASQADIGVLVISARKGEFETGYERGGQTREHVQLAKTLGVSKLLVVVNKMDDSTVNWSKERYSEIESKMVPFLKSSGYNVKKDIQFLPISGLHGTNMQTRLEKSVCPWWDGPCLFEALDVIEGPLRDPKGPFRMTIIDKFKDMGTVVMGKVESGSVREGNNLLIMPNKVQVKVLAIFIDEDKVRSVGPGENLRVRVSGIEEEEILSGFVLSSIEGNQERGKDIKYMFVDLKSRIKEKKKPSSNRRRRRRIENWNHRLIVIGRRKERVSGVCLNLCTDTTRKKKDRYQSQRLIAQGRKKTTILVTKLVTIDFRSKKKKTDFCWKSIYRTKSKNNTEIDFLTSFYSMRGESRTREAY